VPGAGAGCDPRRAERAPLRLAWRRAPLVTCHASILVPPRTSAGLMFSGSLVAIVTPMRSDGALDLEAWSRLIDFHLANGTNGIVVGGTTGESATLRDEELRELTVRACQQLRGRMAVIAGAGTSARAPRCLRAGLPGPLRRRRQRAREHRRGGARGDLGHRERGSTRDVGHGGRGARRGRLRCGAAR